LKAVVAWWLIPQLGVVGAAVASTTAYALVGVIVILDFSAYVHVKPMTLVKPTAVDPVYFRALLSSLSGKLGFAEKEAERS
jgi:hypothetical protein